ncbi:proton myo-inositol cotransporter hmit-1.3-like isoform X2 [Toxorhynchites rutilus septentrionalis]|nr:proton myo-inositol cotransporter hmit-1.3-like isoform X2 [Toxorhynchites rutilus septentrionalis]
MRKDQRNKKRKKPKLNFEGEKFADPDPYQLAVRKTQYGKPNRKFVFEGEKFADPDPFGLAIRKQSPDSDQSGHDVKQEFMKQLHHAHPGLVHGSTEYYNKDSYIADLGGCNDDEDDDEEEDESFEQQDKCFNRAGLAQLTAVSVKNILLLGYGMTLGFPTIVIPAIQGGEGRGPSIEKDFTLSKEEISWLSSINLICVPLGCLLSGALAQPIGRRRAMQIVNIPMLISWLLFHFAADVHFLYCGLALAGFSGGLSEAPVLTYVAEITQPRFRGMLATTGSTCVIIGVLIQFLLGSFLRWRTVALCSACIPVISFLLLFLIPESPVWLAGTGKHTQARQALAWLRGWVTEKEVENEFYEMQRYMQKTAEREKNYSDIERVKLYASRSFLQPFAIIALCFFVGHFSGMTTLQTYAVQIFHTLKAPIDKYYATVLLGVAELIGTLFCVCLVHYSGKRPLVFISTVGCAVCFFSVASYSFFLQSIPGSSVNNVVANVSAIKTDIRVIPLNHTDTIIVMPEEQFAALADNRTVAMNYTPTAEYNFTSEWVYDDQNFNPYYLNGTYDDARNGTIRYGEYAKSAIPRDVLVRIPNANENKYLWLPLTLLLGSAFLTHMGIRLIPWLLIGELFAPSIRSGASGIAGATGYIFGFLANKFFLKMLATLTLPGTFWVYSTITFIGAAILYKVLPETEGKSLVEIEQYFMSTRKRSIHDYDLESSPPKPKPRGLATTFTSPPPLPPRSHPLKDDLGRIRKISQQFSVHSNHSSEKTPSRKTSKDSVVTNGTARKISTTSSKGSIHSYTLSSSAPDPTTVEFYRKISASKYPTSLSPITASPVHARKTSPPQLEATIPEGNNNTTIQVPQRQRKVSDMHRMKPPHITIAAPPSKQTNSKRKRPLPKDFNVNSWDSNKKFEEFLSKRQETMGHKPESETLPQHSSSNSDLKQIDQMEQDARLLTIGMGRHRQNSGSLNALNEILGHDNRAFVASRVDIDETKI